MKKLITLSLIILFCTRATSSVRANTSTLETKYATITSTVDHSYDKGTIPSISLRSDSTLSKRFLSTLTSIVGLSRKPRAIVTDPKGKKIISQIIKNGDSEIKLKNNQINPGIYTLKVGDEVIDTFSYGVLAINSDKDLYFPGETAHLQLAALDEYGHTLCSADLELTIAGQSFSTQNNTIHSSDTCGRDNVTDNPDYYLHLPLTQTGKYDMILTNRLTGAVFTQSLSVIDKTDYQIKRIGATRINPFKANYQMTIEVTAFADFTGTITDTLPDGFTVVDSQSSWQTSLSAGQTQKFSYIYHAKEQSPELFDLGPLQIGAYTENRVWHLASDAACSSAGTGSWATAGTWAAPCNVSGGPVAGDVVTILAGHTITVGANAAAASITINSPTTANGLSVSTGVTLTLTGAITYVANATANAQTITLNGTGSISAASLTIPAPTSTGASLVTCAASATGSLTLSGALSLTGNSTSTGATTVTGLTCTISAVGINITGGTNGTGVATLNSTTGTITTTNGITFAGTAANARLTTTGAGTINLTGTISSGGTTAINGNTTLVSTGTTTMNRTTTWGNLTISSGTLTLGAAQTIAGNFTNNSGTSAYTGAFTTTFSGTTKTLGGSFATTFNALTLAASATRTANTSFTVTNALTFTSTTAAAQSLTLGSAGVTATLNTVTHNQPGGAFTSAFNINAGTATISGAYTIPSTSTTATRIATIVTTTGTVNANGGINTTGATGGSTAAVHVINMSAGAGTFNLKGAISTVSVAGASGWTFTMGTSGSTFNYADTSVAQTVYIPGGGAYHNLSINNTNATGATLNAAITAANVTGNISIGSINSGSIFNSAAALAITGSAGDTFRVYAGSTFNMTGTSTYPTGFDTFTFDATSTVNYKQTTTPLSITSATYGNLGLLPAGTATQNLPAGALSVAGTLTCGNGTNAATCSANANSTTLTIGGGLTITASSTFIAHASNTFNIAGSISSAGTFTHSSGTLTLNGTSAQSISGASTITFNNLTVTNVTAAITPTVNFNIAGTLNMNGSATIMTPSASVVVNNAGAAGIISGTGTIQVTRTAATADYSSQYKFTTNTLTSLTIDYAGSGQVLSNLTYGPLKISGSITSASNTASIDGTLNVTGTFTPSSGTITLNNGSSITNSGSLTFFNLTTASTSSVTSNSSFAVGGTFTIDSSSVFTPSVANVISGAGTLTGTGTAQVTRTSATADFSSQYTITGKTLTNLTIDYAGSGQVLSNLTYGHLKISGSIATGTNNATLTGDFTNTGTFTPTAGTITFSGADGSTQLISGSSTFFNLSASTTSNSTGRTLRFTTGSTQNVAGTWTITGALGKVITLESTAASPWTINPTSASVDYASISYSTNSGTSFCATHSTNGGNNSGWNINSGAVCNDAPSTPSLDAPLDTATNQSITVVLLTTTTDIDSDYLRYKIELCTNLGMTVGCQTFDQTSSQTGWSGQNAQTSTAYTSGTQGVYTIQTPLSYSTTYFWRSYAKDPGGLDTWSSTQATPFSFTTTSGAAGGPDTTTIKGGTRFFGGVRLY